MSLYHQILDIRHHVTDNLCGIKSVDWNDSVVVISDNFALLFCYRRDYSQRRLSQSDTSAFQIEDVGLLIILFRILYHRNFEISASPDICN